MFQNRGMECAPVRVCPRVPVCMWVSVRVCLCAHACARVCRRVSLCVRARVRVCPRVPVHVSAHVPMCTCVSVCMCTRVTCMHMLRVHTCAWVPMCLHVVETVFQCPPNSLGTLVSSPGKAGVQSDPHLCSSGHRVPRMFPGRQNQQLPFPKPHSHFQSAGGTSEVVSGRPPGEDPWVFQETAGSG